MKTILMAAFAVAVVMAGGGVAEAQTKFYARERLGPMSATQAATPAPSPTVFNTVSPSPYRSNTHNVNGCAFGSVSAGGGFTTTAQALQSCATTRGAQTTFMYCYVVTLSNGLKQASVHSSECAPTFTGSNAADPGDGWYQVSAIPAAYK